MEATKRIAILSNVNLDLVSKTLAKEYTLFQQEGYGSWVQYAVEPGRLQEFNPDIVFLLLDGLALVEGLSDKHDLRVEIANVFQYVAQLCINNPAIPVYLSNIDVPPKVIIEGDKLPPEHKIMNIWEEGLEKCVANNRNLHIFDLRSLISEMGRANFYSEKMWYLGSIPYSMKGISCIVDSIKDLIRKQSLIRKKVLILDLDNTLWGGVIGEDGLDGIQLSRSLIGAAYRDAQLRIKELAATGVLLAIVSKNNEADVLNALRNHPQMVLREEDFVAIYANWDSKASNIVNLARKLNLGLDSFVFLDDNPVEREEVRLALPEVTVVDFPRDVANLPNTIKKLANDYFFAARLTKEDLKKTEQYQQEALRQRLLEASSSLEDYLKSLQINVVLGEMRDAQIERVAQLTQKTNQFNILTARYTTEQLMEYKADKNKYVIVANVSDKYGDSGLVFVLMIAKDGEVAQIDNLLMSCRVMGRQIEYAVMDAVEDRLRQEGIREIRAKYVATEKNKPVADLMERLGYDLIASDGDKVKYYKKNLTEFNCPRKAPFQAVWG